MTLLRRAFLLLCALLLLTALTYAAVDSLREPRLSRITRFARNNLDKLLALGQVALLYEDNTINRSQTRLEHSGWRLFMVGAGITSVHAHASGALTFHLNSSIIEGGESLRYLPENQHEPFAGFDMHLVTQDGQRMRYEGGMGGRGYIELWQVAPHVWYEEAYLPT